MVRPEIFAVPEGISVEEHISRLRAIRHEYISLILRVWSLQPDGTKVPLDALVDTGCEVNLIRAGLVPQNYFSPSTVRIRLVNASGEALGGGAQQVKLNLQVQGYEVTEVSPPPSRILGFETIFYEADISVDIILSYKWLYEYDINIFLENMV